MTTERAERRRRRLFTLAAVAAGLAAVAFVTVSLDVRSAQPNVAQGAAVPGLTNTIARAQRITVTSAEATYRIEKTDRGWAMRDRGDYPVDAARLAQLTEGLANLQITRRMTANADRFARLGVDDPAQGGRGVLVQIEDAQGARLVNLILGVETQGLYVRRPDESQVFAARGELPPLRNPAAWLSLTPLSIEAANLARVEIVPNEGRPYILERERTGEATDFAIVAPARLAPIAPSAVTSTAEKVLNLSPLDVQTAAAIQGAAQERLRLHTFDGVLIDAELIVVEGRVWLKMSAQAERPDAEAAALAVNNASAGWAYQLSPQDAEALAPPLTALLPAPPAPPPSAASAETQTP